MKTKYIISLFLIITTAIFIAYMSVGCNLRGNILDSPKIEEVMEEKVLAV